MQQDEYPSQFYDIVDERAICTVWNCDKEYIQTLRAISKSAKNSKHLAWCLLKPEFREASSDEFHVFEIAESNTFGDIWLCRVAQPGKMDQLVEMSKEISEEVEFLAELTWEDE